VATAPKIIVIDYESGNLRSVSKALEALGVSPLVTGNPERLVEADAVILPGVGSAPQAMAALEDRGFIGPIRDYVMSGKPFFGVCLGLQLLLERTEEGAGDCLDLVAGQVKRFAPGGKGERKVPHMGWNSVEIQSRHPVFDGVPDSSYFYFVHSYYAAPDQVGPVAGTTDYGVTFCSVLAKDNLVATQFHPEKSGPVGLRIYRNFIAMAAKQSAVNGQQPAGEWVTGSAG
jgi:glutamine amidotransferase